MRKLTTFVAGTVLAATLLPVSVFVAFGQTAPPTSPIRPTGPSSERHEAARERFNEVRTAAIRRIFDRMTNKIDRAILRLESFSDRIASRIEKFKARGKNVSSAEAKLAEAQIAIADAKVSLADAKAKFAAMLESDDPKTAFKDVHATIQQNVVSKIKAAHAALVDAITILKGASMPQGTAPPTVPPTVTVTP